MPATGTGFYVREADLAVGLWGSNPRSRSNFAGKRKVRGKPSTLSTEEFDSLYLLHTHPSPIRKGRDAEPPRNSGDKRQDSRKDGKRRQLRVRTVPDLKRWAFLFDGL